jgi:hypothetical protein
MRALTCAAIMLAVVVLSVPFGGAAFAQAGSTGGTLGNTDKSISGDREEPRQQTEPRGQAPKREPRKPAIASRSDETKGVCGKFVGNWTWNHVVPLTVVFSANGTAEASNGAHGTWVCHAGIMDVTFSDGGPYQLAISSDGSSFHTTRPGPLGLPVSGERK